MDKESQRYRILSEITKYQESAEETTASMFMIIDSEDEYASSFGKGSIELLVEGFEHLMDTDKDFNQLMKAMMGLYLANNQEEKVEFIRGLELIKNMPNSN